MTVSTINPTTSSSKNAAVALPPVSSSWDGVMKWKDTVAKYAKQYGVPANLVFAMMKLESNGQNLPANKDGAVGPMQITSVWDNLGNRFDPVQNIKMACQILKIVRDEHPDLGWDGAIRSYFSGQPYPSEASDGYNTVNQYFATVKNNWAYLNTHSTGVAASTGSTSTSADLRTGMESDAVKSWQLKLVKLGYMSSSSYNTGPGTFGPKTLAATKHFQRDHGLPQTGVVDSKTRSAMTKMGAALETYKTLLLKKGMEGDEVLIWQRKLVSLGYLDTNDFFTGPGTFGPKTEAASIRFQQDFGLTPVTGQVGPRTKEMMAKALKGEVKPKTGGGTNPGTGGMKYDVPYINQLTSAGTADDWNRLANCGPTTMAMIAKAFGFHRDWQDGTLVNWLGGQAGVGGNGVGWDGVQTMASAAGLQSSHRSGADTDWIKSELAKGHLVAANGDRAVTLQNGGNPDKWGYGAGGHWIAVVGVKSNGNFLVMDPSTDCREMSPSELRRYFKTRDGGGEMVSIWK